MCSVKSGCSVYSLKYKTLEYKKHNYEMCFLEINVAEMILRICTNS